MRLIDADKLLGIDDVEELRCAILHSEPIDAIPIDWLNEKIEEDEEWDHLDEYGEYDDSTSLGESCEHVLANWLNTGMWEYQENTEGSK